MWIVKFLFVVGLCLLSGEHNKVQADEHTHKYNHRDEVVLWMNTVGPFPNRQETYAYFSLPFCRGSKTGISHYHETLSEALQGVELEFSGYEIEFNVDMPNTVICLVALTEEKVKAFTFAVMNDYWYQMYIDGLPIWGKVGEKGKDGKYYIYTHKKFDIGYNGNQIVDISLDTETKKEELKTGAKITFSYEVNWKPNTIEFKDRFDKYLDPKFFQHRIHWFSIFNSFMMVIFLVGLVSMILMRTLRKDYARYSKDEEMDEGQFYPPYYRPAYGYMPPPPPPYHQYPPPPYQATAHPPPSVQLAAHQQNPRPAAAATTQQP